MRWHWHTWGGEHYSRAHVGTHRCECRDLKRRRIACDESLVTMMRAVPLLLASHRNLTGTKAWRSFVVACDRGRRRVAGSLGSSRRRPRRSSRGLRRRAVL